MIERKSKKPMEISGFYFKFINRHFPAIDQKQGNNRGKFKFCKPRFMADK